MTRFGYALSSEEHRPADLVRNAAEAEQAGFEFALISDHFHPWADVQGHSPFVWTVLGGIAGSTSSLEVGTGVTCPLIRTHPAVIAQATATTADLFDGRFFLGVGTGENLNEHILGDHWPPYDDRRAMLIEAVELIRELWEGKLTSFRGEYYVVENARIYTLPQQPIRVMVAASGPDSASMAGQIGDGLITTAPKADLVEAFRGDGGDGKPAYGQMTICWTPTVEEGTKTLHEIWGANGVPGDLSQELALPMHFEQAAKLVTPESMTESMPVGPDVARYVDSVRQYLDAGIENVYIHQVGPDQAGFFRFFRDELQPALRELTERAPATA
jgi:G6PDH family F420-dependent oxidoreductase